MCVIVIKKKGQSLPSKSFLKACAIANPDGCGFASSSGKMWKGLSFERFYNAITKQVTDDEDVVMHFRWATHGSVSKKNCHPFKGTLDNGKDIFFAHNGILSIDSVNDMTDSEICFRENVLPVLNYTDGKFTELANELITDYAESSRFAFVDADGLHTFGDWDVFQGYLCSNTRFTCYLREREFPIWRSYYRVGR